MVSFCLSAERYIQLENEHRNLCHLLGVFCLLLMDIKKRTAQHLCNVSNKSLCLVKSRDNEGLSYNFETAPKDYTTIMQDISWLNLKVRRSIYGI